MPLSVLQYFAIMAKNCYVLLTQDSDGSRCRHQRHVVWFHDVLINKHKGKLMGCKGQTQESVQLRQTCP